LRDLVELFVHQNDIRLIFRVASEKQPGDIFPDMLTDWVLEGRRVLLSTAVLCIMAELQGLGRSYNYNAIRAELVRWAVAEHKRQLAEYPEEMLMTPRVTFRKKLGRRRKDGTTHTEIVYAGGTE
jgi:hypothetical protein